jgi:hypothetical protein
MLLPRSLPKNSEHTPLGPGGSERLELIRAQPIFRARGGDAPAWVGNCRAALTVELPAIQDAPMPGYFEHVLSQCLRRRFASHSRSSTVSQDWL